MKKKITLMAAMICCVVMIIIANPNAGNSDEGPGTCNGYTCQYDTIAHKPRYTLVDGELIICCGRPYDIAGKKEVTPF